jgi:hypothetical protein
MSLDSTLLMSLLQFGSGTTAEYAREVADHARRVNAEANQNQVTADVSGENSYFGTISSSTISDRRGNIWGGIKTGNLDHYPSLASSTSSLSPEMRHRRNELRKQLENSSSNLSSLRERLQLEIQEDTEDRWLKQHKKQTNGRFDGAQRRELRRFFRALDVDSSGEISIAELESPLLTTGVVSSIKELEDLVKKIDHDQSGEIDLFEFMAAFKPASKNKSLKMNKEEASIFHDIKMSQLWKDDANPNSKKVKRKGSEHEGTVYKTLHSNKAIAAEKAAERGEISDASTHPAVAALLMGGGSLIDDEDEKHFAEKTYSAFDELLKVLEGRTLDIDTDNTKNGGGGRSNGGETLSRKNIKGNTVSNISDPILKLKKEPPVYVLRSQHLHDGKSPKSSPKLPTKSYHHRRSTSPTKRINKKLESIGAKESLSIKTMHETTPSITSSKSTLLQKDTLIGSTSIVSPLLISSQKDRSTTPSPRSSTSKDDESFIPEIRQTQRSSLASRQSEQNGILKSYSIEGLRKRGEQDEQSSGLLSPTKSSLLSPLVSSIIQNEEGQPISSKTSKILSNFSSNQGQSESQVQSEGKIQTQERFIPQHLLLAGAAKLSLQTRLASHRRRFVLNLITTERDKYLAKRQLVSDEMKLSFQRGDETRGGTLRQVLRHLDANFTKMMDRMKALMNVIKSELDGGGEDENGGEGEEGVKEEEELDGDDIMEIKEDEEGEVYGNEVREDSLDTTSSSVMISPPIFSSSSRLLRNCKYRLRVQELRAEGIGIEQAAKIAMDEIREEEEKEEE